MKPENLINYVISVLLTKLHYELHIISDSANERTRITSLQRLPFYYFDLGGIIKYVRAATTTICIATVQSLQLP
jgi:hypothetical protein